MAPCMTYGPMAYGPMTYDPMTYGPMAYLWPEALGGGLQGGMAAVPTK